jgi:hypothetical protein
MTPCNLVDKNQRFGGTTTYIFGENLKREYLSTILHGVTCWRPKYLYFQPWWLQMSRSNVTDVSSAAITVFPRVPEVWAPASWTERTGPRNSADPLPKFPGKYLETDHEHFLCNAFRLRTWSSPQRGAIYCKIVWPLKSVRQTLLASTTPTQMQCPGTADTGTLGWSRSVSVRICTARVDSRIVCFYRLRNRTIVEGYSQTITPYKLDTFDLAFKYEYVEPIWTKLILQDNL